MDDCYRGETCAPKSGLAGVQETPMFVVVGRSIGSPTDKYYIPVAKQLQRTRTQQPTVEHGDEGITCDAK
jgi:hypothetical protein